MKYTTSNCKKTIQPTKWLYVYPIDNESILSLLQTLISLTQHNSYSKSLHLFVIAILRLAICLPVHGTEACI